MNTVSSTFGVPPFPPPPPLRGCFQCHGSKRFTIAEALSISDLRCDPCKKSCQALSVFIAEQRAQKVINSYHGAFQHRDEVSFGHGHVSSGVSHALVVHVENLTQIKLEICIDRNHFTPPPLTFVLQGPRGGYDYKKDNYGVSVPWCTSSMESLDWARGCLDYCERFHVQCRQRQSSLPKRVLDLQSIPGYGSDLRLWVSRPHECGRYVTLSHGWGTIHPPKSLLANVQTYLERIRITNLSKKFQQVIQFVRSLGIHFLWIDSLCIIQDDEFDKLEQIPRMSEIYSNSTLTLVISHSKDSTGQLFNSTSQFQSGFSISNEEPDLLVRERFPHKDPFALAFNQRDSLEIINEVFPLLKRAWVFQERILASRMFHFGSYELHWECNAKASCECGIERPSNAKPVIQILGTPYFVQFARLVNYYLTLDLSYEEDILLALQGIIAQCEEIAGERNIAGLLESDLAWCLCWTGESTSPRRRRAKVPTWSWASVLSIIEYSAYSVKGTAGIIIEHLPNPLLQHVAPSEFFLRMKRRVIEAVHIHRGNGGHDFKLSDQTLHGFVADIDIPNYEVIYIVQIGDSHTPRQDCPLLVIQRATESQRNVYQ